MKGDDEDIEGGYRVGRGNPPLHTRFKKGVSGNSNGRPRGSGRKIPHDALLSRKITITDSAGEREVEVAEAFLMYVQKRAFDGDPKARRVCKKLTAAIASIAQHPAYVPARVIVMTPVSTMHPTRTLHMLKMAVTVDRHRPTKRLLLEPWLVQAALNRLDRKLTHDEQATVVRATRTPQKVEWPEWWEIGPGHPQLQKLDRANEYTSPFVDEPPVRT